MEKERVLSKFDVEKYMQDGVNVYAVRKQIEEVAQKIHERGYKNIFLLGIGGTYASFMPMKYLLEKYTDVDVELVEAAELNALWSRKLTKESIVITSSVSGNTKEIIDSAKLLNEKGVEFVAFTKPNTDLANLANYQVLFTPLLTSVEDTYFQLELFLLKLLNLRGEYNDYEKFADQIKNFHHELVRIKEEFDDRAFEIAQKYYKEPYNIWVSSGMLWGETYLFSMCILEEMQWVRTKSVTSAEFFHGTLELLEKDVPLFLLKGEDESRALDERVERFARQITDKLVVIDTKEFCFDGLDEKFRELVSPMIASTLTTERLGHHYETFTKHNLNYRRYYRQFEY